MDHDDISRRAFNAESPRDLSVDGGRGLTVDEGRIGDWMQTYTGGRFYPRDPRPEEVNIIDIALALGNMSRYLGHCRFYSVAEHSVMVSHVVPPHLALEGLLHDAEEAYSHDFIRPWKRALSPDNDYFKLAKRINEVVRTTFGLPLTESREVKEADVAVLGCEKDVLHPRSDPWNIVFPDPGYKIRCFAPTQATKHFLRRYAELTAAEGEHIMFENVLVRRVNALLDADEARLHAHWGLK